MKIKSSDFAAAVDLELEEYSQDIKDGVQVVVSRVASKVVQRLKRTSPKRTGDYAKSWKKVESKLLESTTAIIYNKEHYRLTHLLENGHAKADGGRVEGFPHIAPAAEEAEQTLVADVESLLREVSS